MFQPRLLRTWSASSVETSARKPSHFTSNDQSGPEGISPVRDSIGEVGSGTMSDSSFTLRVRLVPQAAHVASRRSEARTNGGELPLLPHGRTLLRFLVTFSCGFGSLQA